MHCALPGPLPAVPCLEPSHATHLLTCCPSALQDSILASEYVNRPEVIKAIHVKPLLNGEVWATCGSAAGWTYDS